MELLWEIQNFDYFSLDSNNCAFSKLAVAKQVNILINIKTSNDIIMLKKCLGNLPSISNPFKTAIQMRIKELERLENDI